MSKFVVLNIDEGSFEQGFPVSLGIGEGGPTFLREKVTLPPAPDIPRLYQEWQESYRDLGEFIRNRKNRIINVEEVQTTNFSAIDDENNARYRFERYLRQWFTELAWEKLQVRIEARTQPDESIRVIIDTQNIYLKKLPWHLWKLFRNRPQAEFALSAEYAPPSEPLKRPVKILAIFGGSDGLDLTSDRELMTQLESRGAKITCLEQPQKKQLSQSLWKQHWDILFFAGHSSSGEECKTGQIQINDSQSISLSKLRHSLNTAVNNGLKLAIFNSCDGLGLADELIGIKVPQMIVMREPVPDEVARHFLEYFLEDFSKGHSLYSAVRNARQRLEWMEDDFPCASWLPVICQNPAASPLVWPDSSINFNWKQYLNKIAPVSGVILGAFLGVFLVSILPKILFSNVDKPALLKPTSSPIPPKQKLVDLGQRFSWGERIFIPTNSNELKQKGIDAFNKKNYEQSINYFHESLKQNQNDPETLIYLNNAVAMIPSESHKLPVTNKSNPIKCFIPDSKPLKIAVVAPSIQNTQTQINEEVLRGVAQAQNKINSNCGILGRLLQVVIADDNDVSNTSETVAKKLSEQQDILAVVGHYSSTSTLKTGTIYEKNQMVAISPSSTAVRRSPDKEDGMNLSKYVFRTPINDGIAIDNLVDYMVNTLGHKRAAIVYDSSRVYSQKFRQELKNKLESPQINGEFIDIPECDFFSSNANLKICIEKANQTVKVLALIPNTNSSLNKALDIIDSNKDSNLKLLGGDTLYNQTVENRGKKAKNLAIAIPWFQNESNPTPFEKNAQQLWNAQVNWRTAMSYDATKAIIEGLRRMGKNPTRQGLQQVLSAPDFSAEGAAGNIEFDRNGDRKITSENNAKLNVLVQVKCDTQISQDCKFNQVAQ
ncbi:MAG: ABC transporter substrate-binding protein [Rivularia sp. (in: cyanobacteria)]